jgi:two-component system sensor histidine kinase KdpD
MAEEGRPDPDALLQRVKSEEERARRAKLKVYLGFAPGVGKTYAMLLAARELSDASADLVVGWVDTHGRYDTAALLLGLEILPRRGVAYRGKTLEEFDLDAALARRPRILVLDELAHTNAPGSRHPKRWQDALELLDSGIEVHTTLNIQHVESLNDVVAQITGVRVRETVPDAVLDRADEIVLVDLQPEELLQRLREGKVYLGQQAVRAAEGFFQRGNLLALRELALRRAAERVDADMLAYRREHEIDTTWPAGDRILVCIGPAPASAHLVRAGRRMAGRLHAPWTAAWVERPGARPLSDTDRERLEAHLRLAESLGAEVARLVGARPAEALLDYARSHNVTRIVLGKPTHARWRDRLRGSLLDEVVRGSGEIEVHAIAGDGVSPEAERRPPPRSRGGWAGLLWTVVLVAGATGLAALGWGPLERVDVAMLYLLVIVLASVRWGRTASVVAAALSVSAYDFFFILPYHTFAVEDLRHVLTFAMMFLVGLLISSLTLRIQRQQQLVEAREARTATLYALSRELGRALDGGDVARILAEHVAEVFRAGVVVLLGGAAGELRPAGQAGALTLDAPELGVARWALEHQREAGRGTDTLPGARVRCEPIRSADRPLGVLAVALPEGAPLGGDERHLLEALVGQGALALERAALGAEARRAVVRARAEELRSSLLSAVSHDLRTPLAAVTAAASALRDAKFVTDAAQRADLVETIWEEAERLERLVANLLDMTRLESGGVEPNREWVPLEEIVGAVLVRLEARLAGREVHTELPAELPLVSVDPVLLEQLLLNLLENAVKYTPAGSPIEIRGAVRDRRVELEVADRGPGLPAGAEAVVFEKFYRGEHIGVPGVGLGLAIARAIAHAHGGTLEAENRPGGGALFRLSLPLLPGAATLAAAPVADPEDGP